MLQIWKLRLTLKIVTEQLRYMVQKLCNTERT